MRNVITAVRDLVGLFVEDGSLAAIVVVWIAVCGLLLPIVGLVPPWPGAMLFVGLALILVENTLRTDKRRSGRH